MEAQFSLFAVGHKNNEKSPDYTGTVDLDGKPRHDIAVWVKKTSDGRTYYSGKIRPHVDRQQRDPANTPPAPAANDFDSGLPF